MLFPRPALVPEIGSRSFIGRNGENAFEIEARACDSRDSFVDDSETKEIPVFQVPVDLDLKSIRETIQSGCGRRHVEEEESCALKDTTVSGLNAMRDSEGAHQLTLPNRVSERKEKERRGEKEESGFGPRLLRTDDDEGSHNMATSRRGFEK